VKVAVVAVAGEALLKGVLLPLGRIHAPARLVALMLLHVV
jgi:hypothetical protein